MRTISRLALGAFAAALLFAAGAAEAACSRTGYRFGPGVATASAVWRVLQDEPCTATLNPGRMYLQGVAITRQANNGVAGVGSRYQFAYNPKPGFVGRDSFEMRIDFENNGLRDATRVRVNVVVTPARRR
ncbi:MAG: hypothetical protein JNK46_13395 [Methylobacteriaceae bacterium]|nr:hypothetical protein [Methylobacteriaceae bacterium]